MRRFTKEHNDLYWLFPQISGNINENLNELIYEKYETKALFDIDFIFKGKKKFTREDMIKYFMYGAWIAHKEMKKDIDMDVSINHNKRKKDTYSELKDLNDEVMDLLSKLNK